jgi:NAD(P)-dependent dehydrogenase (short-subunit alcohol dehydrogenase family)
VPAPDRKVAVVTGGSQGMGAGIVDGYHHRGWGVVAVSRTIGASADPSILTVAGDVTDPATAERVVEAALEHFGRIDTLVNNAGAYISKPFVDYTLDDDAVVVGVNLTGFFHLTQLAIAHMLERGAGHVVNITTGRGHEVTGDRARVERGARQCRLTRHHSDRVPGELRRTRSATPADRARRTGQRHRRRRPVPGVVALRHR